MKKQYIVQKYVMADSAAEALTKSKRIPVHEIYVHTDWFQKNMESSFHFKSSAGIGFKKKRDGQND